jgi:steroid delta-isomerase-like uncharacterized protein
MDFKKLAQAFHDKILNDRQFDSAEELVNNNVIFYLNQNEPLAGMEAFKTHIGFIQQAFPDLTYTTKSIIQEGNTVALHWTTNGTHTNNLGEIPATGRSILLNGLSLFNFEEGKIKENIVFFNETEIPKQLGLL